MTDLRSLQAGYASEEYTPQDVVEAVLRKIEANGDDKVWIVKVAPAALRQRAQELAALRAAGKAAALPLYGIPFAVKDNIDVEGYPTTVACPEYAYEPEESAPVVQSLLDAGAILVGKTNMDQFAIGLTGARSPFGVPRNPYGSDHIPGGSSSGSAVAVATGLVTFALGTDTAGSGRIPAAFNNVVGLKPTKGLISIRGVIPACRSLDCVSLLATDVAGARAVAEVVEVEDACDPFSRARRNDARGRIRRLGILAPHHREFYGDAEAAALYQAGIDKAAALGFECVEIDFAPFREVAELLYNGPWMAERDVAVGDFIRRMPDAVVPATRAAILGSSRFSASDAFTAYYRLKELRAIVHKNWSRVDALFVPTAPTIYTVREALADPALLMQRLAHYTNSVNLLDLCAIAMPCGFTSGGLPFGISFFAPAFHDEAVLVAAEVWEAATVKRQAPAYAP